MAAPVSYFGIRHHGPGSAAALLAALDELRPAQVLIEGPADATSVLPMLASTGMRPPVALLAYPPADPAQTAFWPFAEYSPEYQATCWAVRHGVPVAFIDLPSSAHFHSPKLDELADDVDKVATSQNVRYHSDPIAVLAEAAGYQDGESWWADLVEQNPAPGPIFAAIADAMAQVRASDQQMGLADAFEARREAHMRLAIAACAAAADGPVAVVCGAWHVPALATKQTKTADKALVGPLPRQKAQITWVPWTSPRLALAVGYGAGVAAPGWCAHLWATRQRDDGLSVWLTQVAEVLRVRGHLVSTASLIEAQRLALALAAIRGRPQPGFEELREACVAAMFGGQAILWHLVEDELLLGNEVGTIPADVPLAPLIEDFQTQARLAKLKPEALERELAVDLRSQSGRLRSTLLHRLNLLGVPWGRLVDAGRTRGTFRERWVLAYEPAFMVELVTNLVFGPTIELAAAGALSEKLAGAGSLNELAAGVQDALTANLGTAVDQGLALLRRRAALSSDCQDILSTLSPLGDILRYGQARETDLAALGDLANHLIVEAALGLLYTARGLDADGAEQLAGLIGRADAGVRLVQPPADVLAQWASGLQSVVDDRQAAPLVAGSAASLLYESGDISADTAVALLSLRLSPGTKVGDAAGFLEGFFTASARRLIYDEGLRAAVDEWLGRLSADDFTAYLPLTRRVFSSLDSMERKHLMAALSGTGQQMPTGLVLAPDSEAAWNRHFQVLAAILVGGEK